MPARTCRLLMKSEPMADAVMKPHRSLKLTSSARVRPSRMSSGLRRVVAERDEGGAETEQALLQEAEEWCCSKQKSGSHVSMGMPSTSPPATRVGVGVGAAAPRWRPRRASLDEAIVCAG